MKLVIFLIFGSFFIYIPINTISQINDIHLSFSKESTNSHTRKYYDSNGKINFHIKNEHFISVSEGVSLSNYDITKINFSSIQEFLQNSNKKRKKLIVEGEKKGVIRLLSNEDVYDNIYIYEKESITKWCMYKVKWVDEIKN